MFKFDLMFAQRHGNFSRSFTSSNALKERKIAYQRSLGKNPVPELNDTLHYNLATIQPPQTDLGGPFVDPKTGPFSGPRFGRNKCVTNGYVTHIVGPIWVPKMEPQMGPRGVTSKQGSDELREAVL